MARRIADGTRGERTGGIVGALKDLSEGMSVLFRQHLELVRLEVKEDARIISGHIAILVVFGLFALVGYVMLNGAAVLFAGWGFGIHGMAVVSLVLAIVNMTFGLKAVQATMTRIKRDGIALDRTAQELERDIEWVKEIRDK